MSCEQMTPICHKKNKIPSFRLHVPHSPKQTLTQNHKNPAYSNSHQTYSNRLFILVNPRRFRQAPLLLLPRLPPHQASAQALLAEGVLEGLLDHGVHVHGGLGNMRDPSVSVCVCVLFGGELLVWRGFLMCS